MKDTTAEIDQRAFRDALGAFATGVAIVTARDGAGGYGITVNSFASVSLDPPLILWCIARGTERFAFFRNSERFAVSVLSGDQAELAARFSTRAEIAADEPAFEKATDGELVVRGAAAWFECRPTARHEGGDHVIIVARVDRFAGPAGGGALTFHRGAYGRLD